MEKFIVRSVEGGWTLDEFETREEALSCIADWERLDFANGDYVEGFYEIYDKESEKGEQIINEEPKGVPRIWYTYRTCLTVDSQGNNRGKDIYEKEFCGLKFQCRDFGEGAAQRYILLCIGNDAREHGWQEILEDGSFGLGGEGFPFCGEPESWDPPPEWDWDEWEKFAEALPSGDDFHKALNRSGKQKRRVLNA